jgi:alpha-beta hydrolase superfamily lysophospholipase
MHHDSRVAITRHPITIQTRDGLVLRGHRSQGPGRPKATVVLVHGFGEHCGRYDALIEALAASRFETYAVDLRGHGTSDGERAREHDLLHYLSDLGQVVDLARHEQPGKPCYLIGHSLGGLIALGFALERQAELDGLILLSPALRYRVKPNDGVLKRVADRAPGWPVIGQLPGLRSRKRGVDLSVLFDPLMYRGWINAGTVVSIREAGAIALERASEVTLPILTMHGDQDLIIDPAGSLELYRAIGVRAGADNSLITWPGMRHELLNDDDAEQVVGVVMGWLNGHYTEWRKANPTGVKPHGAAESG